MMYLKLIKKNLKILGHQELWKLEITFKQFLGPKSDILKGQIKDVIAGNVVKEELENHDDIRE